MLHGLDGSRGLVPIIRYDEPKLPTVYSTLCVSHMERSIYAQLHVLTKFFGGTAQWGGNPKPNFIVGYSLNGIFARKCCELSRLCGIELPGKGSPVVGS